MPSPPLSATPPANDQIARTVESLEKLVETKICEKLGTLEVKLDDLRELLGKRRKDHLVVEEVAELTGRSPYTVRRWITEKKLNAIRLKDGGPRGKLLIPRSEMDRLIRDGQGAAIPAAVLD